MRALMAQAYKLQRAASLTNSTQARAAAAAAAAAPAPAAALCADCAAVTCTLESCACTIRCQVCATCQQVHGKLSRAAHRLSNLHTCQRSSMHISHDKVTLQANKIQSKGSTRAHANNVHFFSNGKAPQMRGLTHRSQVLGPAHQPARGLASAAAENSSIFSN